MNGRGENIFFKFARMWRKYYVMKTTLVAVQDDFCVIDVEIYARKETFY
jgi:hypothetical protein